MKNILKIIVIVFISVASVVIMHSCKKDKATPPILTTDEPSEITQKTVTSGGNITSDGGEEIIIAGICWSTSANPSIKDKHTNDAKELGSFTSKLTGLIPNTKYYIRAYAYNKTSAGYGNEVTFTTSPIALATLTTADVISITSGSAISGGNIIDDGGGIITARGVCWATNANPIVTGEHTTDGTGMGSFTSDMKCLSFATTYYVRAYATNSAGTAYGDQQSFTTQGTNPIIFNPNLTYGSVSDVDGNCYKTVQIEDQIWMAENLKTTKYNDGTPIPNITDDYEWANLPLAEWVGDPGDPLPMIYVTSGAYCWYDNDAATYNNEYGILYNWGAVGTDKLCPTEWHVPTLREWITICDKIDTEGGIHGEELMEVGTTHWDDFSPLVGTNTTGFTALPGGFRRGTGVFNFLGYRGYYWASNGRVYPGVKFSQNIFYSGNHITPSRDLESEREGRSVRCLKDD